MTVYFSDMIDVLRDILSDPADTLVSLALKIRYLNGGVDAMFPDVFQVVHDTTVVVNTSTPTLYDYAIPASVAAGLLSFVELEQVAGAGDYDRIVAFNVIHGTPSYITLNMSLSAYVGCRLRFTYCAKVPRIVGSTYLALSSEAYLGPDQTWELPVYHALGMINARILSSRMNLGTQSVQAINAGTSPNEIMTAAQFWMDRFVIGKGDAFMVMPVVTA